MEVVAILVIGLGSVTRSEISMEPTWQTKRAAYSSEYRGRNELLTSTHGKSGQEPPRDDAGEPMDPQVIAQRRMVHRGIQEHRQTTESAKRSLQIAESCLEISGAVLGEVQRQGESLDKTEKHLEEVWHRTLHVSNRT